MVPAVGTGGVTRLARNGVMGVEPKRLQRLKHKMASSSDPVVTAAASSVAQQGMNRTKGRLRPTVASPRPLLYRPICTPRITAMAALAWQRTPVQRPKKQRPSPPLMTATAKPAT